jgi:hypothetical protein
VDSAVKEADVLTFLGLVVFATIVGIGALDGRSGLGLFARYSSASLTGVRRRAPATKRRGDGNQPKTSIACEVRTMRPLAVIVH